MRRRSMSWTVLAVLSAFIAIPATALAQEQYGEDEVEVSGDIVEETDETIWAFSARIRPLTSQKVWQIGHLLSSSGPFDLPRTTVVYPSS